VASEPMPGESMPGESMPGESMPGESMPTIAADGSAGALELVVGAGRRLRVGPGFDGPTLVRLLALLEEGRP
jgi:hypothetical protein